MHLVGRRGREGSRAVRKDPVVDSHWGQGLRITDDAPLVGTRWRLAGDEWRLEGDCEHAIWSACWRDPPPPLFPITEAAECRDCLCWAGCGLMGGMTKPHCIGVMVNRLTDLRIG